MLKKYFTSTNFLLIGCCLIAIGIPCDGFLRALENIGLIGVFIAAALNVNKSNFKHLVKTYLSDPVNILLSALFILCIFGYLYSTDLAELNNKTGLKVLFILFPIAFSFAPTVTAKIRDLSLFIFISTTTILALLSCVNYLMHYQEYNLLISQSKPIEITGGTMHIYFSVMMAMSVFSGLFMLNDNFKIVMRNFRDKIIFACIIINLIALHILTARTGLFAFYAALVVLLLRYSILRRKFRTLIGGLSVICVFPILMYLIFPSVKNRINNTYEDLHRYFSGDYVGYYSISGRFETWKVAIHIFEDHKLFGVGAGDLQHSIDAQYKIDNTRLMREENLPNCHNQYIETLAAHGLTGVIVFIALLICLLNYVKILPRNNYIMLAFISVFMTAFMVESLFERQAGVTLFLFFLFIIKSNAYDSLKNTSVAPNPNSLTGAS